VQRRSYLFGSRQIPLRDSCRWRSFPKSLISFGIFADAMVHDVGKCGCLVPKSDATTVRCTRLIVFAVIHVTTFPNGTIFAIAMPVASRDVVAAWILYIAPSAAKSSASSAKISSIAPNAKRLSAVSAMTSGCLVMNATVHSALTASLCSYVTSATSHSASSAKIRSTVTSVKRPSASSANMVSAVTSAKSHSASSAKIGSPVKSATSRSVSSAKIPSFRARNARPTSALIAESRSLALLNARMPSAASSADSCLLAAARKAICVLPRRREYLVDSVRWSYHKET
jgi:hypothetical protein